MSNQRRRRKYNTWLQPSPERNPSRPFELNIPSTSKWRLSQHPDPNNMNREREDTSSDDSIVNDMDLADDDLHAMEVDRNEFNEPRRDGESDSKSHSSAEESSSCDDSGSTSKSLMENGRNQAVNNLQEMEIDETNHSEPERDSLDSQRFQTCVEESSSSDHNGSTSTSLSENGRNQTDNRLQVMQIDDNEPNDPECDEACDFHMSLPNKEENLSGDASVSTRSSISEDGYKGDSDSNGSSNPLSDVDISQNTDQLQESQQEGEDGTDSSNSFSELDRILSNNQAHEEEEGEDGTDSSNSFSELDRILSNNQAHEEEEGEDGTDSSNSFSELGRILSNHQAQEEEDHIGNSQSENDSSSTKHDEQLSDTQNSPSDDDNFQIDPNDPPEPFYEDVFETLRKKIESKFSEVIAALPRISAAELLLNALTLIRQFSFNFAQFEGVMKLINTIFKECVVPDTRYKLDSLLKSLSGMHYYFVCMYCKHLLGELDHRTVPEVVCESCSRINVISNLNTCLFFVMFDLPPQIEVLLSNESILQKLKRATDLINNEQPRILRDVYDGKMYQAFISNLEDTPGIHHITFCFGVDGVSLYTRSNTDVWPIFCSILELPPYERAHNLLLAGLWFGKAHVLLDVFLRPFKDHCKKLSSDGFKIKIRNKEMCMKGHVLCCCADAPARAGVQCIHQHGGAYSCNWCLHPSEGKLYRPLQEEVQRRTRDEMITDGTAALDLFVDDPNIHVNGVKGITPILSLTTMDIIEGMILEYFHAAAHGIAETFLLGWLGEDGCDAPYYIGTPNNLEKMNGLLKRIKLPVEARRPCRLLSEIKVWKGRDFENFVLYTSVPVLHNILPARFLAHWNLFVQGLHLLLQEELLETNIRVAEELLQRFGRETERLYPDRYLLYNLHIISEHLAQNCDNWGPCWSVNGYCFEDGNKILKSKIHANLGISSQVCRSLSFDKSCEVLRAHVGTAASEKFESDIKKKVINSCVFIHDDRYYGAGKHAFLPSAQERYIFEREGINPLIFELKQRLVHSGSVYSASNKKQSNHYNCVCYLKDGKVVIIDKIVVSEREYEGYLIVREIATTPFSPVVNRQDSFLRKITFVNREPFLVKPSQLKITCCYIKVPHGEFIIKVPNIHNTS